MQREFRLRHSADFEQLRTAGRQWRHPLMTLVTTPNGLPHNRFGFITSKRLGKAVIRNRVRRRMREAVRHAAPQLKQGYDFLLIARDDLRDQPYNSIVQTFDELVRRAKLRRDAAESTP